MLTLTRRPVEVSDTTARAYFTAHRYLEIAAEGAGTLSAWAIGGIIIAGRQVNVAVLIGDVHAATKVGRTVQKAKALIAEVIASGSRAATLLGDGFTADGVRTLAYHAAELDPAMAGERFASFVARNGFVLAGADKATRKRAVKVSATA